MNINDYTSISQDYAKSNNSGTAYLAFKHIPQLIKKHTLGTHTLDYGCGAGGSISFLKDLGLKVEGVDISSEMLWEAKLRHKDTNFSLINSGDLPYTTNNFDIVFSSFVLFEISSKFEMQKILTEIYRVLKKDGIFIGITGSEELYNHQWLSLDVNFEQNFKLKSGDIAKVRLKDVDLVVYDYFWTNKDYLDVINSTKFSILETIFPIGDSSDGYLWCDEKKYPPYAIYVLQKCI